MEISIKWNICRVCLQEEPDQRDGSSGGQMHNLFDNDKEEISKALYECAGLTLRTDDNLPQKICRRCMTFLGYALNFRRTCRESEEYLNSVIQLALSPSNIIRERKSETKEDHLKFSMMCDNKPFDPNWKLPN
uniref:ZAD domain-containing protein n=1 Tax=Glossina palpalis gambiensis TaxID=67801 RepID=A0A1B0BX24_9MUSC